MYIHVFLQCVKMQQQDMHMDQLSMLCNKLPPDHKHLLFHSFCGSGTTVGTAIGQEFLDALGSQSGQEHLAALVHQRQGVMLPERLQS